MITEHIFTLVYALLMSFLSAFMASVTVSHKRNINVLGNNCKRTKCNSEEHGDGGVVVDNDYLQWRTVVNNIVEQVPEPWVYSNYYQKLTEELQQERVHVLNNVTSYVSCTPSVPSRLLIAAVEMFERFLYHHHQDQPCPWDNLNQIMYVCLSTTSLRVATCEDTVFNFLHTDANGDSDQFSSREFLQNIQIMVSDLPYTVGVVDLLDSTINALSCAKSIEASVLSNVALYLLLATISMVVDQSPTTTVSSLLTALASRTGSTDIVDEVQRMYHKEDVESLLWQGEAVISEARVSPLREALDTSYSGVLYGSVTVKLVRDVILA